MAQSKSRWWDDPTKVKPVLHYVRCKVCGVNFEERSDPRAEFGFCETHRASAAIQAKPATPDWWEEYWLAHADTDPDRKEVTSAIDQSQRNSEGKAKEAAPAILQTSLSGF